MSVPSSHHENGAPWPSSPPEAPCPAWARGAVGKVTVSSTHPQAGRWSPTPRPRPPAPAKGLTLAAGAPRPAGPAAPQFSSRQHEPILRNGWRRTTPSQVEPAVERDNGKQHGRKASRPLGRRTVVVIASSTRGFTIPRGRRAAPGQLLPSLNPGSGWKRLSEVVRRVRLQSRAEQKLSQVSCGRQPLVWAELRNPRCAYSAPISTGHSDRN